MGLKRTCFMVVLAITVLIMSYNFHLYYIAWHYSEKSYAVAFGIRMHLILLADLSFTLAIIFQIILIILIIISVRLKRTCFMVVLAIIVLIMLYNFHLYYIAWHYSEKSYTIPFGIRVPLILLADLSFTLVIIFQIILIILIIISGSNRR